jgi:lipoprotein-anchoring transpeptidase ErfK/SrfK
MPQCAIESRRYSQSSACDVPEAALPAFSSKDMLTTSAPYWPAAAEPGSDRRDGITGEEYFVRNKSLTAALFVIAATFISSLPASADVRIRISKSSQSMTVTVDGWNQYRWPVSTAKRGYYTPTGSWRPFRLERSWYSRKYDNAPMPNSIFFTGGYAIHGTTYVNLLGRPASRGCIRLHPSHARELFALVRQYGMKQTRITITN